MIDKLEMFLALARERHFGRAADAVGVTQPTLSSAIRNLEETLGVQLVQRGSRFQGLTVEGEQLLDWARRIIADTRAMKAELRAAREGLQGRLRLGVIPTALPMATDLSSPMTLRHPGLETTILSRSADEILAGIEGLELDAGITYLDALPERMTAIPLYRERLCLLARADHPLVRRGQASWQEAAAQPLCLLTGDMRNRAIVAAHFSATGHPVHPRIETNSIIAILSHVQSGDWVSVVPHRLAATLSKDQGLGTADLPGQGAAVGLVFLAREPRIPLIDTLATVALTLAGDDPVTASGRKGPGLAVVARMN